jgi:hypothetical protein
MFPSLPSIYFSGRKISNLSVPIRNPDPSVLQQGGVVVDWDMGFKISDLSAPVRAAQGGGGGKKITG